MKYVPYVANVFLDPGMDFHENPSTVKGYAINVGEEQGLMPHMSPFPASLCL